MGESPVLVERERGPGENIGAGGRSRRRGSRGRVRRGWGKDLCSAHGEGWVVDLLAALLSSAVLFFSRSTFDVYE